MMILATTALLLLALGCWLVARIAASPLYRCLSQCFDSWAEASRPAAAAGADGASLNSTRA